MSSDINIQAVEHAPFAQFNAGSNVHAIAISPNQKFLVSGNSKSIQVWRTENGTRWKLAATLMQELAWLPLGRFNSYAVAVSNDSKWIAAGTGHGWVHVWSAATLKQVARFGEGTALDTNFSNGVDFSPDGTRLLSVLEQRSASIWDLETKQPEAWRVLRHPNGVRAARYSPRGDKIATAGKPHSIRIWDSQEGDFLFEFDVAVSPWYNKGLLWSDDSHVLAVSDNAVNEFDASNRTRLSEWPVPNSNESSCLALLDHGQVLAHATDRNVTLWHLSTRTKFHTIQDSQKALCIAPFSDEQSLAIGGSSGKITIRSLSFTGTSDPTLFSPPTASSEEEEKLDIDLSTVAGVLDSWKGDKLKDAHALLTTAINQSRNPNHVDLASRSLIRARLRYREAALADAKKAVGCEPSPIAYIAEAVAHVGRGERDKGYMACDMAMERFPSYSISLSLIKAVVMFMAGEHKDAISHVDRLITKYQHSTYYQVQACMHFEFGVLQVKQRSYMSAIRSFELAQTQMRHDSNQLLFVISLITGWKFDDLNIRIQQSMCDALYAAGDATRAIECFQKIINWLEKETYLQEEYLEWALAFQERVVETSERLGDKMADARRYDEAISQYTTALTLKPSSPQTLFVKRYNVFKATGAWMKAADDATELIALDPSSPEGYELKHAALHEAGQYDSAIRAFEEMLLMIAESPDPNIRRQLDKYVNPSKTRARISKYVDEIVQRIPHTLIDTNTGSLCNKFDQRSVFKSSPTYKRLVSSMTTHIDEDRIEREVSQYFQYVMFSHRWEEQEPLYQQVVHVSVYDLEESPSHDKLKRFCGIAKDAGFNWAWSDTCCINKLDTFVLQEALVVMFKWYEGAAMTIVFLRGVHSMAKRGDLAWSIWNTRAWTLQEYIASKVVRFYTEEWTPYLDLQLPNHKESPDIIAEMKEVTGVSEKQLQALRPGFSNVREKLRLASTRQSTMVEDVAYSLLGIFSLVDIIPNYGERDAALGRLLAHVLAGSGDVSILAWTGESGSYNSCFPSRIAVFDAPAASHLPQLIPDGKMEVLPPAPVDIDDAVRLYDHLNKLPPPWFTSNRMKLPCIAFSLPRFSRSAKDVYQVYTPAFGVLDVQTKFDLARIGSVFLVHPWLNALLEPEQTHGVVDEEVVVEVELPPPPYEPTQTTGGDDNVSPRPMTSLLAAQRLVARLRQPFGALLLAPVVSEGRRTVAHRRVATESVVRVQFQASVSLAEILGNVRTLDVL